MLWASCLVRSTCREIGTKVISAAKAAKAERDCVRIEEIKSRDIHSSRRFFIRARCVRGVMRSDKTKDIGNCKFCRMQSPEEAHTCHRASTKVEMQLAY